MNEYFWVIYRNEKDQIVTSPYFLSELDARDWASDNMVPSSRIITSTKTKRHPTKMSDIIKNKVGV